MRLLFIAKRGMKVEFLSQGHFRLKLTKLMRVGYIFEELTKKFKGLRNSKQNRHAPFLGGVAHPT
jgi:hypothetical protein